MTITRVKPLGWSLNEKLTSAQMNDVDENATNALDKRSGETDTLSSAITMASGSGINVSSVARIIFESGSILTTQSGATVTFGATSAFTGATSFASGVTETHSGTVNFASTSVLTHQASSSEVYAAGALLNFGTGAGATVSGNWSGVLSLNSGFTLTGDFGSNISVAGDLDLTSSGVLTASSGSNVVLEGYFETENMTLNSASNKIQFGSARSFTREIQATPFAPSGYTINSDARIATSTTSATDMIWNIRLPNVSTITSFRVYTLPNGVHPALPATMPRIKLVRTELTTGSRTVYNDTADGSANVAAYETVHWFGPAGTLSIAIDNNLYRYSLVFTSEGSTNAISGALVIGALITYSVASMDDAQ